MTCLFEGGELRIMGGIVLALDAQVDEEAVVAVDGDVADGLAVDGNQTLAFLAGGLSDELLGPGAKIGDLLRGEDRQLVAALEAG